MFLFSNSSFSKLALSHTTLKNVVTLASSIALLSLTACATSSHYTQQSTANRGVAPKFYTVKSGDSLSKIGRAYGLDYTSIAKLNNIAPPYNTIYVGQRLRLQGAQTLKNTAPTVAKNTYKPNTQYQSANAGYNNRTVNTPIINTPSPAPSPNYTINTTNTWQAPVKNANKQSYNTQDNTLYYYGTAGTPVYAAAAGMVVYANTTVPNSGLSKYGNLIMIQHSNDYVSVYAHNNRVLVAQGERIQAGQMIGEMGTSGQIAQSGVGFQIRKSAKNIDPRSLVH